MKKIIKSIILLNLILINILLIFNLKFDKPNMVKNKLNKLNLKDVNNLMIVAHPDDESLWGGVHLSKSDYLVVCVTCGVDKKRTNEFKNAISDFGNYEISLGYPDITNNKTDNWSKEYNKIEKDINQILSYKNWNVIVTHNPDGEFDHPHHKMLSTMISKNTDKNKLYYFNKFYDDDQVENLNYCMKTISDKELSLKEHLLDNYSSKEQLIDDYGKYIIYEKFISYKNWNY